MDRNAFVTVAMSLAVVSTVWAKSVDVYFGTYTDQGSRSRGIYHSTLDTETGQLSAPALATRVVNPAFLELHPNGRFLYVASESGRTGRVYAYAIDGQKGGLTLLNHQSSRGNGPCHVSVDHAGRYVFVANYGSGSAAVLPIQADGKLAISTGFVQHSGSSVNRDRQKGPHAHSANASPDDRFVFVADLGIDKVMIYKLDAEAGTIVPNDPPAVRSKPGAGPRHFAFAPSGKFAYLINEMGCTMTAFSYDAASGALTEIQTVPTLPSDFKGSSTCAEVRVHPSGKFLYGSNRGHDSITVYRIDPEKGTLTVVEHETAGIKTPRNFNIDPTGAFCLVANLDGDNVSVFRIDRETGALTPTGQKVTVGQPSCIRFR